MSWIPLYDEYLTYQLLFNQYFINQIKFYSTVLTDLYFFSFQTGTTNCICTINCDMWLLFILFWMARSWESYFNGYNSPNIADVFGRLQWKIWNIFISRGTLFIIPTTFSKGIDTYQNIPLYCIWSIIDLWFQETI